MAGGVRKQRGRWRGDWYEGGVKKSKVLGLCSKMTKTEAREAVSEIVKRVKDNTNTALFGPFVEGPYLNFYTRKWKGSTRDKNVNRIDVHLVRAFRDCEMSIFRRDALQDFLDEKAATLSFSMVNHLRWDLKQIFDMAIAEGHMQLNPAKLLFTPRTATRALHPVMTTAEAKKVIECLGMREALIAKLAILAGMRPGEIFALRWQNVSETFVEVRERVYEGVLDSPKSDRGYRKVGLTEGLRVDFFEWAAVSRDRTATAFVFPSERGTPLSKHNVWRRNMQPKLKAAGLGGCTFQMMRRTFATLSKLAGGDPKVIADQAGHDIGVSLNTYIQSPVESKLVLVNALEKLVFG